MSRLEDHMTVLSQDKQSLNLVGSTGMDGLDMKQSEYEQHVGSLVLNLWAHWGLRMRHHVALETEPVVMEAQGVRLDAWSGTLNPLAAMAVLPVVLEEMCFVLEAQPRALEKLLMMLEAGPSKPRDVCLVWEPQLRVPEVQSATLKAWQQMAMTQSYFNLNHNHANQCALSWHSLTAVEIVNTKMANKDDLPQPVY